MAQGMVSNAEAHALRRVNKNRLWYGSIYVASQRRRNGKTVMSKPCIDCAKLISKWNMDVWYRDANGTWQEELI